MSEVEHVYAERYLAAVELGMLDPNELDERLEKISAIIESLAGLPLPAAGTAPRDSSKVLRVIEAATFANFCPSEGGYKEGRSVEDCYEELHEALCAYYGVELEGYSHPWWTEEEMRAALSR